MSQEKVYLPKIVEQCIASMENNPMVHYIHIILKYIPVQNCTVASLYFSQHLAYMV